MGAVFISKSGEFFRKNDSFKEILMGHMAMDIEVAIKTTAGTPVKTGGMKSEVRHFKAASGKWRVEADKTYSAVQEAGIRLSGKGAPTKPFTHYTTAGTSSGWFRRAIDSVMRHRDQYVSEAKKAAGF
jgi:hypothetical protein